MARLVEMAESAGANAVVGLRFDCSEITQSLSEVAAYGTAVRLTDDHASTDRTEDDAMSDTAEHHFSPGWPEQFEARPGSNME